MRLASAHGTTRSVQTKHGSVEIVKVFQSRRQRGSCRGPQGAIHELAQAGRTTLPPVVVATFEPHRDRRAMATQSTADFGST